MNIQNTIIKQKKSSTKYIQNEIRDTDIPLLIKEILQNIIASFKKHQIIPNEIIDSEEKLLMWDKVTLKNNIYFKNIKEKKGNYIYPCKFKEYINNENIKVSFEVNINNNFRKDQEIIGNVECYIIIPEFLYNYYSNLYSKDQVFTENMLYKEDDDQSQESYDYMVFNSFDNQKEFIEKEDSKNEEKDSHIYNKKLTKKIKDKSGNNDEDEDDNNKKSKNISKNDDDSEKKKKKRK